MSQDSFGFIHSDQVDDYLNGTPHSTQNNSTPPRPPIPQSRQPDEILSFLHPPVVPQPPIEQHAEAPSQRGQRIRIETTKEQLVLLTQLFVEHGDVISVGEISARTRLSRPTVYRLLRRLKNGQDITKKAKRGRKPKHSPQLLKTLSTKLCFERRSVRETSKLIAQQNMQAIESEVLPVVSKSSIQRYVTDATLMTENELVALSFSLCTRRGPNANSDENKELRVAKRIELDRYIRGGFALVFVDESHWDVGNVRSRKWGEKGKKHFRTEPLRSYRLTCICAIGDSGTKHCRLFNGTINGDIFLRYMKELLDFMSVDNKNVLFVMDDAPIHKGEVVQLAGEHNHEVLFNAPYSPKCNPIEMVFGFWKTRVGQLVNVDIADMITNISQCFEDITPAEIKKTINHFIYDVTPKIFAREDL